MAKLKLEQALAARLEKQAAEGPPADDILGLELGGRAPTEIPVDRLRPNRYQHRQRFEPGAIEELAASIREHGLIEPILVRPDPDLPGGFEIAAGERRWRAYQLLGRPHIPAQLRQMSDHDLLRVAVAENVQREDITDFERAVVVRQLFETRAETTVAGIARLIRRSRQDVYRYQTYFQLPDRILDLITAQPQCFGATAAQQLHEACQAGQMDLAFAAAERVASGKLQQTRIQAWIDSQINPRVRTPSRAIVSASGQPVATLRRDRQDIRIRLDPSVDADALEAALLALLAQQQPSKD